MEFENENEYENRFGWIVVCAAVLVVVLVFFGLVRPMLSAGRQQEEIGRVNDEKSIRLFGASLEDGTYTLRYESQGEALPNFGDICTLLVTDGESANYDDLIGINCAPVEADSIGVYNSSEEKVGVIQLGGLEISPREKLYSFGLLSDAHVGYGDENYANALKYLTGTEQVDFIVVTGDLTDSCTEWETYKAIVDANAGDTPVYEITGNHDTPWWRNGYNMEEYSSEDLNEYTQRVRDQIETYTGDPLYYSFSVGDDVFIMVGLQSNYGGRMFTQEELQWLHDTLEENQDKRCFVFEHVLPDGGSGNANGWADKEDLAGTEQEVLVSLLKHYPNVTLFHGHTHQSFRLQEEADDAVYDNYLGCHSVHVPSVGGTRGPQDTDNGGSQGYVVDVYADGIALRGMDFQTGEYLPVAQYWLDTTLQNAPENAYEDPTYTINCGKVDIEWIYGSRIDKSSGAVSESREYCSTELIPLDEGVNYYFHTIHESPYKLDIYCYDASGVNLGYFSGPWENELYTEPVELNPLLPEGTASIRLTIWTDIYYVRKTAPIYITAVSAEAKYGNALEAAGYTADMRISGSTGDVVEHEGTCVTGLIPVTNGMVIRLENITMPVGSRDYQNMIALYTSDGALYTAYVLDSDNGTVVTDEAGNVIEFAIHHNSDEIAWLRICAGYMDEKSAVVCVQPNA